MSINIPAPLQSLPKMKFLYWLQSNLLNVKSSGLEILFRMISSSSYREVDMKIYNPKNDYYYFFLSIKHKFGCVKEKSQ